MSVFQPRRFGLLSPPFLSVSNRNGLYVGFNQLALDPPPDCIIHDHLKIMVRLLQLRVFDTKRDQIVKCEEEPLHIAAAPGCFIVSTAAGILNVYSSESEGTLLFQFKTKNQQIWDLQYSQFDDSLLTVENEGPDSAIRVVRHYVNWRSQNSPSSGASTMEVYDLVSSRSVRFFTIDSSQMKPMWTKPDAHRRSAPYPYFQIVVSTVGMVSLYRVQCTPSNAVNAETIQPEFTDIDPHFAWVFSIKAQAVKIGLCDSYLTYSTQNEVFLLKFAAEQTSMEDMSLTRMCKTAVEAPKTDAHKLPNHSIILSTTTLKRIKNHPRRSGSSSLSRSSSFASSSGVGGDVHRTNSGGAPLSLSRANSGRGAAPSTSTSPPVIPRASLSPGTLPSDAIDSVELSKHHIDLIFHKSNAIKNKAPYAEMPLDVRQLQIINAQGPPLGPAMTLNGADSASDIPSQLIGPIRDVHSYVVNTDEDFVLTSAHLLFYRNLDSSLSSSDDGNFVDASVAASSEDSDAVDRSIHSLALLPIWSSCAPSNPSMSSATPTTSTPTQINASTTAKDSADKSSTAASDGPVVTGVRLFVSSSSSGLLWMFKRTDLCESVKYHYLKPTYKSIVTDTFIFSLTNNNTVLIHLMRNLDSQYSGSSFERLKGELTASSAAGGGKRASRAPSASAPQPPSSKALVQQSTDPLLIGALDFLGLSTICVNSNGNTMILCKSTEDQIAALRDASLSTPGKARGRSSSASLSSTPPTSPTHGSGTPKTLYDSKRTTLGWNLVFSHFNSVQFILNQFQTWTGAAETIEKEDLNLLLESWTFTMSVLNNHSFTAARSSRPWTSDSELANATSAKRSIYGKLASFEFANNRLLRSAILWSLSDVPADKAINNLVQRMKKGQNEQIANMTQAACVEFLTRVLLGSTQRMDLIELSGAKFADVVYAILVLQNAPLLGQVVLESPLDKFELENTIILLEKTMSELEDKVLRVSNVVSSFLSNALVLNLAGDVEAKPSPLDDFYSTQTLEERQLWMSTLALVVLLLRQSDEGLVPSDTPQNQILTRRTVVIKGSVPILQPEHYLVRLPEAFLVPYLSTHSHLMFTRSPLAADAKNWSIAELDRDLPSPLARLLSDFMPWTCLEIMSSAGPEVFGHTYVSRLLSPNLLISLGITKNGDLQNGDNATHAAVATAAPSTTPKSASNPADFSGNPVAPLWNPLLLTAYYEYLVMPYILPSIINGSPSALASQPGTTSAMPICHDPCTPQLVETIKALLKRYIDGIEIPIDDVLAHLSYVTPELVARTNPHNTDPPVSLEGIWKEYHRDIYMESRYKFLAHVPPMPEAIARVRRPGAPDQILLEHFYLCKLQALLCALSERVKTFPALGAHLKHICQQVIEWLKEKEMPEGVTESIHLLCKPHCELLDETIDILVQRYPDALISFLKKQLTPTDMSPWKRSLDVLLRRATAPNAPESTLRCLEEFLKYMARNLSSSDFLNLLPANGNVAFFIPYIELSLGRNASMDLLEEIQSLK